MSILPPTADWSLVEVRGKYVDFRQNAIEGSIIFTPRATRAIDADLLTIVIGKAFSVDLVDGEFAVDVPATDDPDITPIDFTYQITEQFQGGSVYDIEVPIAQVVEGIDLATVSPTIDPSTGEVVIGVSDHGLLTGLSDDDHSQYHNDTRGDIRYYTKSQSDTQSTNDRARANHTGTQPASTISDFTEVAQDAIAAMLAEGANVTLAYNDAGNTLTVTAEGGDAEVMRDTIGAALAGINGVVVAVNDGADTITLSVGNITISQVTDLETALADKVTLEEFETLEATVSTKAPDAHLHDDEYQSLAITTPILIWYSGDAEPDWVAEGRPDGLRIIFILDDETDKPIWATARDLVFVRPESNVPEIRNIGSPTILTADAGTINVTLPATVAGDSVWILVGANQDVPPPSGWTDVVAGVNGASTNSINIFQLTGLADGTELGDVVVVDPSGSTALCALAIVWIGEVAIDEEATNAQTGNDTSHDFPAITPGAESTVIGISGIRYSVVAGNENTLNRVGWTKLADVSSNKAGAPNRGVYVAQYDTPGANGVLVASSTATCEISSQFATEVLSVVKV